MVHTNVLPKKEDLTKVEVGEIDTRAPFQSVKDAVNLFGDRVALSGDKTTIKKAKPVSAEKALIKETECHLAQKELNRLKEQVQNAENTKAEALVELEKAKQTMEDLSRKLKVVTESKEAAVNATEAAEKQAEQFEEANSGKSLAENNGIHKEDDPEGSREKYSNLLSDLNALKQELAKIRRDYDMCLEEKATAVKQAEQAEVSAKENREKASQLSNEISALKETIEQVKEMSGQGEQGNISVQNDAERESYKARLEESAKKLEMMKKDFDPQVSKNLETQLAEVMGEIDALRKELEDAKAWDSESMKSISLELDIANESLRKVVEEGNALESLVDSLKRELEILRKEHAKLKEKEVETESITGNLHVKLRKCKSELEVALAEEAKATGASEEMISMLSQLASEAENARRESEEMRVKAEEVKREAEATRVYLEEAEELLKIALREAEEAKSSEARALDKVKALTEQADESRSSTSLESGDKITISREEFEALSTKVEESEKLTEMKVAAALAQVEAVKASESEALKRLEATQKDIEDMKASTEEALKMAKKAEEAKKAVEGELRRWREKEHKKASEIASQVLEQDEPQALEEIQTQLRTQIHQRLTRSGPVDYKVHHSEEDARQRPPIPGKKLEKQRSSFSRKVLLPSLSGIFTKRSPVERGSPSNRLVRTE